MGASINSGGRELFLAQLPVIDKAIGTVIRKRRLVGMEAEDFASIARLRLIDNDYQALRKFGGRGSWRRFLTTVVERIYLDYRVALWGRWRPSTRARRAGGFAVLFERLIIRDKLGFDEACEILRRNYGVAAAQAEFDAAFVILPRRHTYTVSQDVDGDCVQSREPGPETMMLEAEAQRAVQTLDQALADLPPRDRRLIQFRFVTGLSVPQIAQREGVPAKVLYGRLREILRRLRADLECRGISHGDIPMSTTLASRSLQRLSNESQAA